MSRISAETTAERAARARIARAGKRKSHTIEQRLQYLQDCAFLTMRAVELLAMVVHDGHRSSLLDEDAPARVVGACVKCGSLHSLPAAAGPSPCSAVPDCDGIVHALPPTGGAR